MKPVPRPAFIKSYEKLPISKRKKFDRLLPLLLENPQYPSLRARKMSGSNIYEARLDEHYLFPYHRSARHWIG